MKYAPFIAGRCCLILSIPVLAIVPIRAVADGEAVPQELSSTPPSMQTETVPRSPLGDRRLFFTAQQRLDAPQQTDSMQGSVKRGTSPQQEPLESEHHLQQAPSSLAGPSVKSPLSDKVRIYFNAMVNGPRGTHLLVNGLPCFPRSPEVAEAETEAAQSGKRMDCPGVSADYPGVSLILLDERLHVLQERSASGVLSPGQGL